MRTKQFNESLFIKNDFKSKKAKEFPQVFQFVSDVKCWAQQFKLMTDSWRYYCYLYQIHKDGLVGWYKFETSSWGWASNNPLLLHNTIVDR
ncbi:hypothetical protein PROFUN_11074 [Planoprotostelium fungivorum]|uniref:Uncharacterized protein n=1 Tax=Planoprotostelium fungivorum TaxID=1890364 RepID=A0A2P6NAI4_9EUKA|nr:hypothetical protein PROFUN_11074 [Planoprotostelium fungivorum]